MQGIAAHTTRFLKKGVLCAILLVSLHKFDHLQCSIWMCLEPHKLKNDKCHKYNVTMQPVQQCVCVVCVVLCVCVFVCVCVVCVCVVCVCVRFSFRRYIFRIHMWGNTWST